MVDVQAGTGVGLANELSLCNTAGHSDTFGAAVLVDASLADDAFDMVTILKSGAERLDDDGSNTITTCISVGLRVPHAAATCGGEHLQLALGDVGFWVQTQIGAGSNGGTRLAGSYCRDGVVQGNETR